MTNSITTTCADSYRCKKPRCASPDDSDNGVGHVNELCLDAAVLDKYYSEVAFREKRSRGLPMPEVGYKKVRIKES